MQSHASKGYIAELARVQLEGFHISSCWQSLLYEKVQPQAQKNGTVVTTAETCCLA